MVIWSFPGSLYFQNTRKNLKSNLILVVVLVLESKDVYYRQLWTTMASNGCEEAPTFLLWTADILYELPEVSFQFSFNLHDWRNQLLLFQQSNHCAYSSPSPRVEARTTERFWRCFEDGHSQRFRPWRSRLQRSWQGKSSDESTLPHYLRNLIRE